MSSTPDHQTQTADDHHQIGNVIDSNTTKTIQQEIEELLESNKKQEKRINNLESKALQDVNRYFVVQGVFLSSITSNNFRCKYWWITFVLSLLTGILNSVNLYRNTVEFLKCSEELDQNIVDLNLKKRSLNSNSQPREIPGDNPARENPDSCARCRRRLFSYLNLIVCTKLCLITLS
ncbi:hypothetical protein TorRG33x02_321760 [Trema orientale]|uniref:Transmembrane protein n=1 Tax=Trema orientale TaxID=63057 RepID=A0A2P5BGL0_TREOI|nr:hypothetical protein TorRG33x02_321760 [Trema orientale]